MLGWLKRKRASGPERTLIYTHIPKAAGTTLNTIIERNYPAEAIFTILRKPGQTADDFKQLPAPEKLRFAVVKGHCPFGLHEHIPRPATYVTILRDPVERVISHYYYVLRTPEHYLHQKVTGEGITLRAYLASKLPELDNGQVRIISGAGPAPAECTRAMLDQATRNLEAHFSVVGLVERFDETLTMLQRVLGWKDISYRKQNVTEARPKKAEVEQEVVELIRSTNALDVELYEHARRLFENGLKGARA